jgi:hypothetical protein
MGSPRALQARFVRGALDSLLLAALALFFLNLNLFGTATPSKRYSQDLVYAWFGDERWLYPRPDSSAPPAPGQPRVVVVVLDEQALATRAARWPVPVEFHAQLLAELAVLRPRAILLDFLLIDPATAQETCDLLTVGAQLRHGPDHTALYLAVPGPTDDLAPIDTVDCRDRAGKRLDAKAIFQRVSVARLVDGTDFVSRLYPFGVRDKAGAGIASAAVQMYCDTEPRPKDCVKRLTDGRSADAGFDLAWSPQGDRFNQRWSALPCRTTLSPVQAVLNRPALPRESPCPPVPTLWGRALLSPEEDPALGVDNAELFRIANKSILLVGGDFRGTGDLITTPLHTLLPGVYYHAVALENLLAFKGYPKVRKDYRSPKLAFLAYDLLVLWLLAVIFQWRQARLKRMEAADRGAFELSAATRAWIAPLIARSPTAAWMLAAVLVLLLLAAFKSLQLIAVGATIVALVVIELRVAPAAEIQVRVRALVLYLLAMGASVVVIALAMWVGYSMLDLPPSDWLGYLSFAAFGYFLTHTAIMEFGRRVDELHLERRSHRGAA